MFLVNLSVVQHEAGHLAWDDLVPDLFWLAFSLQFCLDVFFIFLVANVGGSLTPLGDPPLFLGFLKGVGFFWTPSI